MIKVGLIGAGFMGNMHATCYEALKEEGVIITAVADVRNSYATKIAKQFGASIYEDGMSLINKADVDVIDICLPTYLHTEHAIEAMKKNRHVFIEKPVCLTKSEGDKLLKAQKETDKLIMVGQCIRLWDEYVYLKNIVEKNEYGKVITATFKRISPLPTWAWNNWLHKVELSGSVALDMHIHDSDFIRYLLGEPSNVNAVASRDSEGIIQQMFTTYEYPNKVVHAEVCWNYPDSFPFCMEYRVKLENATIVYDSTKSPTLIVYPIQGESFTPKLNHEFTENSDLGGNVSSLGGYYNELKYFTNKIKEKGTIEVAPLNEGIKSVNLVLDEINSAGGVKL